ncbi:MAG TPA: cytochrome c [Caulobacteraceae bacterium]|nr:cytochrome c [Caulobacteraceae bacterium]
MRHLRSVRFMIGAGAVLAASAAFAAGLSGADAAKDRQSHMKEMQKSAKAIVEQLKAGKADPAVVGPAAKVIAHNAPDLPKWFPKGSGKESGVKTHALPIIWTDRPEFEAKARALAEATPKLLAVANSGDPAKVGAAMKEVGGACKSCHEKFEEKHDD